MTLAYRMSIKTAILLLGLCLGVVSCSNPFAGGPSSVETQNSVAGILTLEDGTPVSGALVRLYRANAVAMPMDSTTTTTQGEYRLSVADSNLYSLEFSHPSGVVGRILQQGQKQSSSTMAVQVQAPIRRYLTAGALWQQGQVLRVSRFGSEQEWTWSPDTALSIHFPSLGMYAIRIEGNGSLREEMVHVRLDQDTLNLLQESLPSILLSDFESKCNQNSLGFLLGGSWAYVVSDAVTLQPPQVQDDFNSACVADSVQGQAVQIGFTANGTNPWMAVGMVLGLNRVGVDLRGLDSLVFMARGQGYFSVGFVTLDMVDFEDYAYAASPELTLTEQWTRYSIATSLIQYPQGSTASSLGFTWMNSASQTLFLQWGMHGSGEIWLDDIRMVGVTLSELW